VDIMVLREHFCFFQNITKGHRKKEEPAFNIIGSCADLLHFHADAEGFIHIMKGALL